MGGLIFAAPSSGSGKTTVTLGFLRAATRMGATIHSAKSGPDYIDPRFHEAASGAPCVNLDAWAMTPDRLHALAAGHGDLIVEGAMGLFDGAPPAGRGATADLARHLSLPVVLVVDCAKMAGSVAPLVAGFAAYDPSVKVAGVILNNVGSPRHEAMLRHALSFEDIAILGIVPRDATLAHPSRHLGLVQASERADLETYLDRAADVMGASLDMEALLALAASAQSIAATSAARIPPPAQRIAIARDQAFAFAYPHVLDDWRAAGAELTFFSPLADEGPQEADFIFLPGGYPELHAGQIAGASTFMQKMKKAAENTDIYGECGGYMVMGQSITDASGTAHQMLGLLDLATSFQRRKLHLGYRHLLGNHGPLAGRWAGHEFHYATTLHARGAPLFRATDAEGTVLPDMGLCKGCACGSFAHLIDRVLP
ncbi:cobyrinate a,c-diamide synthase [Octadecabacter sp. R77987]|uniref:cobyrinate a,c-diamide synthase n=1 Tax=Octadecabacter sp. R77987 TaxID=3093874 RepID=UPI0036726754